MFKFNFYSCNEKTEQEPRNINWIEAQKVHPNLTLADKLTNILKPEHILNVQNCNLDIKYISTRFSLNQLKQNLYKNDAKIIFEVEQNHSDLITSQYEGGLKVWEGTQDLAEYISNGHISLENKTVLDLGCGAGILGLTALKQYALSVCFQDYNSAVLEYCTIPNLKLNGFENELIKSKCEFYSGDWESFNKFSENRNKFDIILTSETIYNIDNYKKLHAVFKDCLSKNGIMYPIFIKNLVDQTRYLAAKTCYFGVGGGTRTFEKFLESDHIFEANIVWQNNDGVKREILKIQRKEM